MNPLNQYAGMIKLIGGLALVLLIWFHGYSKGNDAGEVDVAKLKAGHAETLRAIADQTRIVADLARDREYTIANEVAKAAADYEDKRHEIAQTTRNAVLDDLRAGRIRLRDPCPGGAMPATGPPGGAAGGGHGQACCGSETAAAAVGIGAEADAQLAACQAVIRAYTAAPGTGTGQP